ncbi:hypothetical protein E1A91_A09G203600v1 [Gossypium mustelinum]|uniref:Reticulon-like protein n=1 Tax=Gossypium mustelinum TaxID=34275 RepID=A0A5D2Y0M9_GOSMU|nr:hypothetical protein E1A91_A09G203600v1 [Gossypium mustelinum]
MGEHEEKHEGSLMEKLAEKIHGHDSSSDSDNDKPSESSTKAKVFRLFGRERSPLCIPEVHIPKDPVIEFAEALRFESNLAFTVLRDIASGRDLKKFLYVIAGLWILSIVGSWCNFVTLFYLVFVLLHSVPVLYEKYEDKVDPFAEKAMHEIKKQCAVFNAKVLSKIPRGPSKEKNKD